MSNSFMDRYGYYQIGDFKTYSVYQVMDYYHKDPQPYVWIYNDDFFSQYDWSQEPKESLDELYKNRAKELREQYDYIVLYYSGGYDSSNMLRAFLDNGIYPDEICVFYSRHDTTGHQYHELKDFTWKKLAQIEQQYPQIKIRRFDYGDIICNWPKLIKDANEYLNLDLHPIYLFGPRLSVNRLALDVMYEHIDDWKQLIKDKKKLCTLHGVDSVALRYNFKTKTFEHNYSDAAVSGHLSPIRQMTDKINRDTLEFFYWAPTEAGAKIMIKQGHLGKKFFTELSMGRLENLSKIKDVKDYVSLDRKNFPWMRFLCHDYEAFKKLIYPKIFMENEKYYNKKEKLSFWGNRDLYYYNSNLLGSKEHWNMYHSLFDNKKSHWKKFFYNNDISQGPITIRSKGYTI
jgi:hypothetical protein